MILDKNRVMKFLIKYRLSKKKIIYLKQFYKLNKGIMYFNYDLMDLYFKYVVSLM